MKKRTCCETRRKYSTMLFQLFCIISVTSIEFAWGNCREQTRNTCEIMCPRNSTNKDCNLRAVVILPQMDTVEASLPKVITIAR